MRKKVACFIVLSLFALFYKAQAQVPLFIEEDDTSAVYADTLLQKKTGGRKPAGNKSITQDVAREKISTRTDSLVKIAYGYLGNRYRRGGTGAKGFDCSGYTMTVFARLNIKLPHTSAGQGLVGVDVSRANIQKGDLIFFRGANRRSRRIGHVGIVISEKGEPVRFIHSSTSEGVRIDRLEFTYYKNRYVKTVRIPELYR
jgi:cell wall-associated NlpC family hydrolase